MIFLPFRTSLTEFVPGPGLGPIFAPSGTVSGVFRPAELVEWPLDPQDSPAVGPTRQLFGRIVHRCLSIAFFKT